MKIGDEYRYLLPVVIGFTILIRFTDSIGELYFIDLIGFGIFFSAILILILDLWKK